LPPLSGLRCIVAQPVVKLVVQLPDKTGFLRLRLDSRRPVCLLEVPREFQ